jgi:Holliday junction resolvase-like predicted endonuclease
VSVFYITKASGEKEQFDATKVRLSLKHSGVQEPLITTILEELKQEKPQSTRDIHRFIVGRLEQEQPSLAARYNLKQALLELGPAGFPFEQFIAQLFQELGYLTATDQMVRGFCVTHEIDIIATKEQKRFFVECKFHNRPDLASEVKVTLYMQAAFEDIVKKLHHSTTNQTHNSSPTTPITSWGCWGITNTRFTTEAKTYATCVGMRLTSWKYPVGNGLAELIDRLGLHPVTALTLLTHAQKKALIAHGCVLCRDIKNHADTLKSFCFSDAHIKKIITEAQATCSCIKKG